ncbi:hypothetical protein K402DRAFT_397576 [Aulographum hederae CBS 113979]|uniref:Extracellular membrane protein CFEM domain-containing protein n=1 Tax=Aulographum hederae CBS 113979 TaxID=1176131 RepID=A0A6G1GNK4_9PEZI|nr:hypothetical protein K402DRAFT_397576 [Aulographum hederae CBS 113979]
MHPHHLLLAVLPVTLARSTPKPPGTTYMCTLPSYQGECFTIKQPLRQCVDFAPPLFDNFGSFKPVAGTACRIFSKKGCHLTDWFSRKVLSDGYSGTGLVSGIYGAAVGAGSLGCWKTTGNLAEPTWAV